MKTILNNLKQLSAIKKLLKDIFHGHNLSIIGMIVFQVIAGVAPVVSTWVNGKLIDHIIKINLVPKSTLTIFILLVASAVFCLILMELAITLNNFFSDYFQNLIYYKIHYRLLEVISSYPTHGLRDSPKANQQIALSRQQAESISEHVTLLCSIFLVLCSLTFSFILCISIAWWIPWILVGTMIPLLYARTSIEHKLWNVKEAYGETFNKLHLHDLVLTNPEYSKDIRLYNMHSKLLQNWSILYKEFFQSINKARLKGAIKVTILSLISGIGLFTSFGYVAYQALYGTISIGQLSFLLGIIIYLKSNLSFLLYNSSDIIRALLSATPLMSLLELPKPVIAQPTYLNRSKIPLIVFEDVTFTYPGASIPAIKELNFILEEGESLAIVGENGSGKSTLIKLLCRLYEPTSGKIYWNGRDIASLDFNAYRDKLAVLFQDFACFPLSVRDNILVGCKKNENKYIYSLLDQVDLGFLKNELDHFLTKRAQDGLDLSGGQWQRLAIARLLATIPHSEVLVFDEPTSALDPQAEHKMLMLLGKIIQKKTSIVISHRLALCRITNNILVMDKGKFIEYGNHEKLIQQKKGAYCRMFTSQAQWYKV